MIVFPKFSIAENGCFFQAFVKPVVVEEQIKINCGFFVYFTWFRDASDEDPTDRRRLSWFGDQTRVDQTGAEIPTQETLRQAVS